MALRGLGLLALFILPATAKQDGNLTITFFRDNQLDICEEGNAGSSTDGIVLTTSSIPWAQSCFNLAEIFMQDEDEGFVESRLWIDGSRQNESANREDGVHYLLRNRKAFDNSANYTNVWFKQSNATAVPGEPGPWVIYTYTNENCRDLDEDKEGELGDYWWYKTSCQTEAEGQCETSKHPILSIGIAPVGDLTFQDIEPCRAWSFTNTAPRLDKRGALLAGVVAGVATYWFVM